MTDNLEPQTPPQGTPAGEQTPQTTPPQSNTELDELRKKNSELEAQKEHWRTKYERDITNVPAQVNPESSDDVFSDEGKAIVEKYVAPLQQTVSSLQDQLALKELQAQFPELKDLSGEFETYRRDFPRHKLENVAKLFLQEKGLLSAPPRPGLENPTGGPKNAPSLGMTRDEVENLRKNNYKKYQEMLIKGQIQITD